MKRVILALFLITNIGINAQVPFCVAPLKVGNIWVYTDILSSLKSVQQVTDSIFVINDNKYHQVRTYSYYPGRTPYPPLYFYMLCRYDSTEGTFKYYDRHARFKYSDYTYYKKGSVPGDRWMTTEPSYNKRTVYNTVMDSATIHIFPSVKLMTKYVFITDSNNTNTAEYWTEELGIVKRVDEGAMDYLTGCIIDGKIYGDTSRTLTGLHDEKRGDPVSFCLYQNYPNPFNPSTNIKYFVPNYSFVSLKIYNVLGKEIKLLVNEYKAAGVYETEFNGECLPSGIYVCTLISGKHKENIKITLLK